MSFALGRRDRHAEKRRKCVLLGERVRVSYFQMPCCRYIESLGGETKDVFPIEVKVRNN